MARNQLPHTTPRDKVRYVVDTLEINAAYQVSIVLRGDIKIPINRFTNIIAASTAALRYKAARQSARAMGCRV